VYPPKRIHICINPTNLFKKSQLILCIGLSLAACKEPETKKVYNNVDERLHSYFQTFEEEAKARGFEIDLNEAIITAHISSINGDNVAGQCSRPNVLTNDIVIDESFLLGNASSLLKELVVFHELGHCFLQREHREDAYPTGTCISIMRSGLEDCRDNYTSGFRSIYLDELFDPDSF